MTPVAGVCALIQSPSYATIDFESGRNPAWDRAAVDAFMLHGTAADLLPREAWSAGERRSDVVSTRGQGILVSTRLRVLFDDVAPNDLDFRACTVDERAFWFMRVVTERDAALDSKASGAKYGPDRNIVALHTTVWRRSKLGDVAIFRLASMQSRVWATDTVAAAYLQSGYTGLQVVGPYGEVR